MEGDLEEAQDDTADDRKLCMDEALDRAKEERSPPFRSKGLLRRICSCRLSAVKVTKSPSLENSPFNR